MILYAVSPKGSVAVTPNTTDSFIGDVVNLTCQAQGGPGNSFTWTSPSGVVENTPTISVSVDTVLDGRVYTCTVENDAGASDQTATING